MKESEKVLERKLSHGVQRLGGWCIKLVPIHLNGLPDRMCLLPGARIFFAEVKSTGKKPRKIQRVVCNRIRQLGFRVEIIESTEQIKKILKDYEC